MLCIFAMMAQSAGLTRVVRGGWLRLPRTG